MKQFDEDLICIYKCRVCNGRVTRQEAYKKKDMTCICVWCAQKLLNKQLKENEQK